MKGERLCETKRSQSRSKKIASKNERMNCVVIIIVAVIVCHSILLSSTTKTNTRIHISAFRVGRHQHHPYRQLSPPSSSSSSSLTLQIPAFSRFATTTSTRLRQAKSIATTETPLFVDATTTSTKCCPPTTNTSSSNNSTMTIRDNVQQYYGVELQSTADLQTNACCTGDKPPAYILDCIQQIHPTVLSKYYGCGLCLPTYDMTDCIVLDLGCGAGRDVYIASQLVGPNGFVTGIDMTKEQLDTARQYQDYHAKQFGYKNVQFLQGYLEELHAIPELKKGSFDIIVSNCVLNLCTNKQAVLQSCYELLKPGGELYFSDVYASRRVPKSLQTDPVLWGECLSGALYWNDFYHLAQRVGFIDPRLVEDAPITIANPKVLETIQHSGNGNLEFYSATYRLMKIDTLEPDCEDYGQAVVYMGTIPRAPTQWKLDKGHVFETGKMFPVCGNTYRMLQETTTLKDHFTFHGNFDTHYGIFEGCGSTMPYDRIGEPKGTSCC